MINWREKQTAYNTLRPNETAGGAAVGSRTGDRPASPSCRTIRNSRPCGRTGRAETPHPDRKRDTRTSPSRRTSVCNRPFNSALRPPRKSRQTLKNGLPHADKGARAGTQTHAHAPIPTHENRPCLNQVSMIPQKCLSRLPPPTPSHSRPYVPSCRHEPSPSPWTIPSLERGTCSMNFISITCWSCKVGNYSASFQIAICSRR